MSSSKKPLLSAQQSPKPRVSNSGQTSDLMPVPGIKIGPQTTEFNVLMNMHDLEFDHWLSDGTPGWIDLLVYRNNNDKAWAREVLVLESCSPAYETLEMCFKQINILVKSIFDREEPAEYEEFRRFNHIAELRYFAKKEGYTLRWFSTKKMDKHKIEIRSNKDPRKMVAAESKTEDEACNEVKKKFENKQGKKFQYFEEILLAERLKNFKVAKSVVLHRDQVEEEKRMRYAALKK